MCDDAVVSVDNSTKTSEERWHKVADKSEQKSSPFGAIPGRYWELLGDEFCKPSSSQKPTRCYAPVPLPTLPYFRKYLKYLEEQVRELPFLLLSTIHSKQKLIYSYKLSTQ